MTSEATSEKDFATLFVRQIRLLGDTRKWSFDAEGNRLVHDGADSSGRFIFNLGNMYKEWLRLPPAARQSHLERIAQGMMQDYLPSSLRDAQRHILPIVRSMAERGQVLINSKRDTSPLVYRPLIDGMELGLAYDTPQNMRRLCASTPSDWGISEDEAFAIALHNLRVMTKKPLKDIAGSGLYAADWNDGYDTSRLLLPEYLKQHITDGAPVVMIPNRNLMLLTSDCNPLGLDFMMRFAEEAVDEPRPLPPNMLRLIDDQWTNFSPAAYAVRLNHLQVKFMGGEYASQKRVMQDRLKEMNAGVFVATYKVGTRSPTEPMTSVCTWSKSVVTLLPVTDLICILDPHGRPEDAIVVPLKDAIAVVGNLMSRTPDYPPRLYVEAYPDNAQIAQLRQVAIRQ